MSQEVFKELNRRIPLKNGGYFEVNSSPVLESSMATPPAPPTPPASRYRLPETSRRRTCRFSEHFCTRCPIESFFAHRERCISKSHAFVPFGRREHFEQCNHAGNEVDSLFVSLARCELTHSSGVLAACKRALNTIRLRNGMTFPLRSNRKSFFAARFTTRRSTTWTRISDVSPVSSKRTAFATTG